MLSNNCKYSARGGILTDKSQLVAGLTSFSSCVYALAQIMIYDDWIEAERSAFALVDNAAALHHVGIFRNLERAARVLLDEEHAQPVAVQFAEHLEDLSDNGGPEAETRLIEQ